MKMLPLLMSCMCAFLGDEDWKTRDNAEKYLTSLVWFYGDTAPIEAAMKSSDFEVRARAKRIYEGYWREDFINSSTNRMLMDLSVSVRVLDLLNRGVTYADVPYVVVHELRKEGKHPRDIRKMASRWR